MPWRVVLDSNILCADFHLKSTSFHLLFDACHQVGDSVYVSQIVLSEVANKYTEEIVHVASKLLGVSANPKNQVRLQYLLNRPVSLPLADEDVEAAEVAVCRYLAWLETSLQEHRTEILSYPSVDHASLVDRDLARKKPFSLSGRGYRDALIWETVLSLAQREPSQPIAFVSRNARDFGDGASGLHPDLTEDLMAHGLATDVVVLFDSVERWARARFKELIHIPQQFAEGELSAFDIPQWVMKNLQPLVREQEWGPIPLGLPADFRTVWVQDMVIRRVEVLDVLRLPSTELLLGCRVDIECVLEAVAATPDFLSIVKLLAPSAWYWQRDEAVAEYRAMARADFVVTWDPESKGVTSAEVLNLSGTEKDRFIGAGAHHMDDLTSL